jgi:Holliday junction DNA helicase RuvA
LDSLPVWYSEDVFNSIRGTITEKAAGALHIWTGGIEWDITCPDLDMEQLPPPGAEGRVFIWLYHREDQMRLFGFASEGRRAAFLELLKVEGVGPKGALKILGGVTLEAQEAPLENEDLAALEALPGLGKKTAQKMLLTLRGKLAASSVPPPSPGPYAELTEALVQMGYDRRQAAEALSKVAAELAQTVEGTEKEQQLFRRAIVMLSGA